MKDLSILLIGASGYIYTHILEELLCDSELCGRLRLVRLFDTHTFPHTHILKRLECVCDCVECVLGDVCVYECVRQACVGVNVVFHGASAVDVHRDMHHTFVYKVNVGGTQNVINACVSLGVECLVYTSTAEVASDRYSGEMLTEFCGLCTTPINAHTHEKIDTQIKPVNAYLYRTYAKSKHIADILVCNANGLKCVDGSDKTLSTVCVRSSYVYGERDKLHIEQMLSMIQHKKLKALFGSKKEKHSWVYVRNAAYGHLVAYKKLHEEKRQSGGRSVQRKHTSIHSDCVGGTPFNIFDDTPPMGFFEFLQPLVADMGAEWPRISIPYFVALILAYLWEFVCSIITYITGKKIRSPFCVSNVEAICIPQTFSYERSRRVLKYTPKYTPEEALSNTREYYRTHII